VTTLDKGGIVFKLGEDTAMATMGKLQDWCVSYKIRAHLPRSMLAGTVKMVIKYWDHDQSMEEVIKALQDEGLKLVEIYMIKNKKKQFGGIVKITAKGSEKVQQWLEKGQAEIHGARYQVEKDRRAKKCFNCNKFGHMKADCPQEALCRRCGQPGHLGADCTVAEEELRNKCGYCFDETHNRADCQHRKDDERKERENHRKKQQLGVAKPVAKRMESVWGKQEPREPEKNNDDTLNKAIEMMREEMERQMESFRAEMVKQMAI